MLGGVVSTTETVCVAVEELPDESVAVHVMVVSPSGNESGASLVTDAIPTRSSYTGLPISNMLSTDVAST